MGAPGVGGPGGPHLAVDRAAKSELEPSCQAEGDCVRMGPLCRPVGLRVPFEAKRAPVAQWIERRSPEPKVAGSIPARRARPNRPFCVARASFLVVFFGEVGNLELKIEDGT